jgi:putative flippase GtrA
MHIFKRRFFIFLCVGTCVALFQFTTFFLFHTLLDIGYLISSSTSFVLTVFVSFLMQKHITFQKDRLDEGSKKKILSFSLFILNSLFALFLNGVCMYIGVEILGIHSYISQILTMGFLATYNFFVYTRILG